eukprot:UN03223
MIFWWDLKWMIFCCYRKSMIFAPTDVRQEDLQDGLLLSGVRLYSITGVELIARTSVYKSSCSSSWHVLTSARSN